MSSINLYQRICTHGIVLIICGLDQYNSRWSAKAICSAIEKQDDSIAEVLYSMDQCGTLDMLVVLCIIVDTFCSEDVKEWFYFLLQKCSEEKNVIRLKDLYFQEKELRYKKQVKRNPFGKNYIPYHNYILSVSVPSFEEFIWDNIEPEYLRKINKRDSKNIGLWYCGLYANSKEDSYFEKLEKNAFPCLIMDGTDIKDLHRKDEVTAALIRMRIADYLIGLSLFYYSKIEKAFQMIFDMDAKTLAEADHEEFSRILQRTYQKETGGHIYISSSMVDDLEKMFRISQYFGDHVHRQNVREIKCYLPLFYQMLGKNEEAISLLIDQINFLHPGERVRNIFCCRSTGVYFQHRININVSV